MNTTHKKTFEVPKSKNKQEKHMSFEKAKPQKVRQPRVYITYKPKEPITVNSTTDNSSNRSELDEFSTDYKVKKGGYKFDSKWDSPNQEYEEDFDWDDWKDWDDWETWEEAWRDEMNNMRRYNKRKDRQVKPKNTAISKISCTGNFQAVTWSETGGILKKLPPAVSK